MKRRKKRWIGEKRKRKRGARRGTGQKGGKVGQKKQNRKIEGGKEFNVKGKIGKKAK